MEHLLRQFKQIIGRWHDSTIYVGFSGGADSTALLLLLDRCAEEFKFKLSAVHFDHGLRQGSEDDALWCEKFCLARYIDFRIKPLEVPCRQRPGESVESAARRLRLEAWREMAGPDSVIALGHHSGDRVENALLRLCRGSNVSGLTSLRREQTIDGMHFIRPLLGWSKEEIEKFLASVNISAWREDASNRDPVYKRNFFRQEVLPHIYREMPPAAGGVLRSLEALEQDAAFIEEAAVRQYHCLPDRNFLPASLLRRLHPALLVRVLRMWLSERTGGDTIPDYHLVERVAQAAARIGGDGETRIIPFRRDLQLAMRGNRLTLHRPTLPVSFGMIEWNWQYQEEINYGPHRLRAEIMTAAEAGKDDVHTPFSTTFAAAVLPEIIYVRTWKDGDRIAMAGHRNPVKLKKLFTDHKIKAGEKKHYAVVTDADGVLLWVAGLYRGTAVLPDDTEIVRLTFIPGEEV